MSNKNTHKRRPPAPAGDGRPPGKVLTGTHGLQSGRLTEPTGVERLKQALENKNKNKRRPPAPAGDARPPGKVLTGKHGLQTGPLAAPAGVDRLKAALGLKAESDVERICDEAAVEIERLRDQAAKK